MNNFAQHDPALYLQSIYLERSSAGSDTRHWGLSPVSVGTVHTSHRSGVLTDGIKQGLI